MSARMNGYGGVAAILCGNCSTELEHCHGEHGTWMHSATRREHCRDGRLAVPETIEQFDGRRRSSHSQRTQRRRQTVGRGANE